MNTKKFNTIGYFIKHYFNWSMDYSDLECCIEDFMYTLNDPKIIREVAYNLGDRGMPTDKALDMITLLYIKTQEL